MKRPIPITILSFQIVRPKEPYDTVVAPPLKGFHFALTLLPLTCAEIAVGPDLSVCYNALRDLSESIMMRADV